MSDGAPREQTDTETEPNGHGLRVPFSAHASRQVPPERHVLPARRALAAAVAVKLTLDLLFVCALAVYTQAVSFRADFDGVLEYADGRIARGWVKYAGVSSSDSVELQLYVDGRFAAAGYSNSPYAAGAVHGDRLGFVLSFPQLPPGEHEVRVYAVRVSRDGARRTLRQIGGPLRFVLK
jgi:hypothetical protein